MRVTKKCICHQHRQTPATRGEVADRCERSNAILASCDKLIGLKSSWTWIAQCRVCGTLWAVEHLSPHQHGGGPACPYIVPTPKHVEPDHIQRRLREADDLAWFATLGPEVGPQVCGCLNCDRLRIDNSKYCRVHHFRRVKGYRVPGT